MRWDTPETGIGPLLNNELRNMTRQPSIPDFDPKAAIDRCRELRLRCLEISQQVSALHMAPAFSCLEIVDAIYSHLMRQELSQPPLDTFILSKGHGFLAQLVVLEAKGVIPSAELVAFCTPEGSIGVHPDYGTPGVSAATGSLGHGLAMGVGIALANRATPQAHRTPVGVVYVVLSDGELQEGSTWEAIMLASSLGVQNLVVIVDNNDFQSLGRTSQTHPSLYPIEEKFEAFGWEAASADGHDSQEIVEKVMSRTGNRPYVLIAKTTKGKGVSYMENEPIWHYRSPSELEYRVAVKELGG